MNQIAERAGVGKATVSLALRDDPRLRPETRRRIQKLAAKMGYRTNATVANLMAQLRASRTAKYQATLGLLNVSSDSKILSTVATFREWVGGCNERASQLGYGLDTFWLYEPGISPSRLYKILESRNIRGLIIAALFDRNGLPEEYAMIWRRFACIVIGLMPNFPALNFASNDQFSTSHRAVQRLWGFGYRRIALVLDPDVDATVERRFSAGFWAGQEACGATDRIPIFPYRAGREISFRAWYAQHRPDAILCVHEDIRQWIDKMGVQVPTELGLAHLDRHDDLADWAGMNQNNTLVGAAAIDMLVGQLHRNEVGLPEFPKASFIQSTWVEGPSLIQRPARKSTHRAGYAKGAVQPAASESAPESASV